MMVVSAMYTGWVFGCGTCVYDENPITRERWVQKGMLNHVVETYEFPFVRAEG